LENKQNSEKEMFWNGTVVQKLNTDNDILTEQDFISSIEYNLFCIYFSRSGAHHQKGVAKQSMGTIFL
jgi:hypothetical protein